MLLRLLRIITKVMMFVLYQNKNLSLLEMTLKKVLVNHFMTV